MKKTAKTTNPRENLLYDNRSPLISKAEFRHSQDRQGLVIKVMRGSEMSRTLYFLPNLYR